VSRARCARSGRQRWREATRPALPQSPTEASVRLSSLETLAARPTRQSGGRGPRRLLVHERSGGGWRRSRCSAAWKGGGLAKISLTSGGNTIGSTVRVDASVQSLATSVRRYPALGLTSGGRRDFSSCATTGRYCRGDPDAAGGASSCRDSHALSSAPVAARPTAPGNTLVRIWSRASRHAATSMPSTRADASSQPRTGPPRSRAMCVPSPSARSRAPTMRAKRLVPPRDPSLPVIVRPTNPGARSDATPMAILPRARLTARSLPSIAPDRMRSAVACRCATASCPRPPPTGPVSAKADQRAARLLSPVAHRTDSRPAPSARSSRRLRRHHAVSGEREDPVRTPGPDCAGRRSRPRWPPLAARRYSQVMGDPDRRRRSRSGRILDALLWGAALGAASGAVLGDAIDGVGAGAGARVGAAR
jgi:hypothetical protein